VRVGTLFKMACRGPRPNALAGEPYGTPQTGVQVTNYLQSPDCT
jgi:hypothetical protein